MREEAHEEFKKQYIFQMSSLNPQERIDYCHLIEKLGGLVIEKQCFDPKCTHIVVGHPLRNEKYLASVAAGKWVLHRSYLEACRTAGRFVQEENYEWGSSSILDVLTGITEQQRRLALAAMRWRKKSSRDKNQALLREHLAGGRLFYVLTVPEKRGSDVFFSQEEQRCYVVILYLYLKRPHISFMTLIASRNQMTQDLI